MVEPDRPTLVMEDETMVSGHDRPDGEAPPPGTRFGRYLLLDRLGRGGMGEVFAAYDPELDRRVALKILRRGRRDQSVSADRLVREAKALAKLAHPNVVAVYDVGTVGEAADPNAATVYIAMEYVEGQTLHTWLEAERPWRERLAVLLEAGAGLAAAHREGLVHRDFKPANVMVGTDARVRVLDFGLARAFGPSASQAGGSEQRPVSVDSGPSSVSTSMTATGWVMGTPAYMAPEQFAGDELDARSDQFAFCIVAFEALFGARPFEGTSHRDLERSVRRGKLTRPPGGSAVPKRVRDAIIRGLAVDPDQRHPSMDALLTALARAARPPRVFAIAAGSVTLALGSATIGVLASHASAEPCTGSEDLVDDAWNGDRSAAMREAFLATSMSYAEDSFERSAKILDEYATRWAEVRTEACIATRVRKDQSEQLMDLRMACLDRRRAELGAFVDVLIEAEGSAVEKAVSGARTLTPLDHCSDAEQLRARVPAPADPEIRVEVDALSDDIARSKALNATGQLVAAIALTRPLYERAREIDHLPLRAEAAYLLAYALENAGHLEEAEPLWLDGLELAAGSGDAWVEAKILIGCAAHFGYHGSDLAAGLRYSQHARGVVRRAGSPPELEALVAFSEAMLLFREGSFDDSVALYRRTVELCGDNPTLLATRIAALINLGAVYGTRARFAEAHQVIEEALRLTQSELGPKHPATGVAAVNLAASLMQQERYDESMPYYELAERVLTEASDGTHPELAKVYHNVGQLHRKQGDFDRAQALYEKSLAMKVAQFGQKHPSTAYSQSNLADLFNERGEYEQAAEYASRALATWEATVGPDHAFVAYALLCLSESDVGRGLLDDAVAHAERALQIRTQAAQGPSEMAEARFQLGVALWAAGRTRERAMELVTQARADAASVSNEAIMARIDGWLAAHPPQ